MSARRDVVIGRAFGIGAALAYGVSSVLIRHGVTDLASPLVGAAVSLVSGTVVLGIIGGRNVPWPRLTANRRPYVLLLISGIAASLGILSSYLALSRAPVVVVSPLQSTSPLFTLLWSYLLLGRLERITPRLVLGSVIVVVGVVLITVGRVD